MSRILPQYRLFLLLAGVGLWPLLLLPLLGLAPRPILLLVPVVGLLLYLIAIKVAQPHLEVVRLAQRLRAGDLKARALLKPGTDWSLLASVLTGLADQLDSVTRNLEQEVEARTAALSRKADQLRAVGQVGQQVASVLQPDNLLHFVTRVMRGTFGYDLVAVLLQHGDHLVLTACAARGIEEVALGRVFPRTGPGAIAAVPGGNPSSLLPDLKALVEMAIPIRLGERTLGLMVVQSLDPTPFDSEDRFTVKTIAGQVAVALENARLLEAERRLRSLAITEERNRMAREIHDTLAQGFMGIIMQLRAMQTAADPETASYHAQAAESLAQESLQEARRSVWNLRPRPLTESGLAEALAAEVEGLERQTGMQGRFQAEGDLSALAPSVEVALLRIAQEAIHNAIKYAQASHLDLRLSVGPIWVELEVSDDGVGFDPSTLPSREAVGGGFGLITMGDRARLLGGELTLESAPGKGCRICARIPLRRSRSEDDSYTRGR